MYEKDLKRIVCLFPDLIEEGLSIEHEEFPIRSGISTYRCDLKGKDKNGNTVFIELKLKADEAVLFQIGKYKTFVQGEGRFMVAAFDFKPDLPPVLSNHGYEYIVIDQKRAALLLEENQYNPDLFNRKLSAVKEFKKGFSSKSVPTHSLYKENERQAISELMNELKEMLKNHLRQQFNITFETFDIRKKDEHRLIFQSPTGAGDKFIIYTRPREMNIIELQFVPDFSLTTGYTTPRKEAFKEYVNKHKNEVLELFGFHELFSKSPKDVLHMGDHLLHTKQAWKALHYRIVSPIEEWNKPDFCEWTAMKFIEFIEILFPFIREFELN
ncbi:endonuclease NucS domain-containing protein [Niallia endozanthoxylica]|nr:endonuclease NucS domain-containing protein [Niallia endozanthoxylica]